MRGFKDVPCICCNNTDNVAVELFDTSTFHCANCDKAFSIDDVLHVIETWKPVLEWLATAPETTE